MVQSIGSDTVADKGKLEYIIPGVTRNICKEVNINLKSPRGILAILNG